MKPGTIEAEAGTDPHERGNQTDPAGGPLGGNSSRMIPNASG